MSGNKLLAGLWAASLSGGVITLAVLLLRTLFQNRTPRRVFCLLWDVVMARLLILAALPSPVSVWRWLPARIPAQRPGAVHAVMPSLSTPVVELVIGDRAVVPAIADPLPVSFPDSDAVLFAVWLAAALALAVWFLWGHLRFRRFCASSLPCADAFVRDWLAACHLCRRVQVRTSDRVAAPLTYGILRPVILLPSGMDWRDRAALFCVLEHESQHIRRFDTLRKALLAAALCLHWFNPLTWTLYVLSNRDMELACDEAVTTRGADRAGYARTLLNMEEQRGQWGLSGSHFSQNALEERIRCIMRNKKTSISTLVAVLVVMGVITAVFAFTAPEDKSKTLSGQDVPETSDVYNHQDGENGEKQYSLDSGKTWMNLEQYNVKHVSWAEDWQAEWWTAGDYAAWLEEEKQALQSIIGERGYTGGEGWFTWDQKRVDETVALYESILEDIKNGALYSRRIVRKDGSEVEDTVLGSGGAIEASVIKDYPSDVSGELAALLKEAEAFGVTREGDQLYYKGQIVHTLVEGHRVDRGYTYGCTYKNDNGTIDLQTRHDVIMGADGHWDTSGRLTGILSERDAKFDREMTALLEVDDYVWQVHGSGAPGNADAIEAAFSRYEKYGLVYLPRECGIGSMAYNGQPVKSFDGQKPDGSAFSYEDPNVQGGLRVYAEYDAGGHLTGLRAQ